MVRNAANAAQRCAQVGRRGTSTLAKRAARKFVAHGAAAFELVGGAVDDDLQDAQERLLGCPGLLRRECLVGRVERRKRPKTDGKEDARGEHKPYGHEAKLAVVARSDERRRDVVRAVLEGEPARRLNLAYLV